MLDARTSTRRHPGRHLPPPRKVAHGTSRILRYLKDLRPFRDAGVCPPCLATPSLTPLPLTTVPSPPLHWPARILKTAGRRRTE